MKTMTLTATNRPDGLRQTLDSLAKNAHLDEYVLFCAVEPVQTAAGQEVRKICQEIDFMKKSVVLNPRILGVKDNPFAIQKRVFDIGSEFNIYLEDDVVLSPDAIELCEWYRQRPDLHTGMCLNLYNPDESDASRPVEVVKGKRFSSLNYATTRDQWRKHFEPNWYKNRLGWDYSIVDTLNQPGMFNTMPALSRSHHIGLEGIHYRKAQHDSQYLHNPWHQGPAPSNYEIKE